MKRPTDHSAFQQLSGVLIHRRYGVFLESVPFLKQLAGQVQAEADLRTAGPAFHPPGAALMRSLSAALSTSNWRAGELTNWRDSGWSIECVRSWSELQIALAQIQDGQWMLQVSPLRTAGLIAGLFGGKSSASAQDVFELAIAVHRALIGANLLGDPKWRWDGFPDEKHSTSEPIAA